MIFLRSLVFFALVFSQINAEPKRVKFNKVVVDHTLKEFTVTKSDDSLLDVPPQRILLAVLVKNHAYSLPTFLATLETLDCPTLSRKCDIR